ncbi:MAG TPA: hypothetical protein DCZ75_07015 [Geobacter sp.]|nr:hypothetical protein [Geobacter sp.]
MTEQRMRLKKILAGLRGPLAALLAAALLAPAAGGAATLPAPTARTGATLCYDAAGNQVPCAGSGQDGGTLAGVAWPSPRFRDNGDGTLSDLLSGLDWTRDANAPGPAACSPGLTKNWQSALSYAKCLNDNAYLGKSDWRLPNVNELRTLLHGGKGTVSTWLTESGFINVASGRYKSSTAGIGNLVLTPWTVNMDDGSVQGYNHLAADHVWPVRSGSGAAAAPVPRTGSTQCYDFGTSSLTSQCTGTGQDGELKAGAAWPEPRFTASQETVVDNLTGLEWLKDGTSASIGGCSGGLLSWQGALSFVDCLNQKLYLNKDDWRMPNLNELESLGANAGNDVYFYLTDTTPGFLLNQNLQYWSSTSYARDAGKAWGVWFSMNGVPLGILKGNDNYVLPVRDNVAITRPPVSSATPPGGVYTTSQSVVLSSNVPGSTIYYSTDGTTPTLSSAVYGTPILVKSSKTIQFFAVDSTGNVEEPHGATYTINDFVAPVTTASPAGGTFTAAQSVTLTCADAGSGCAATYYTTDGSTPTTSSSLYGAAIPLASTTTLKFFSRDAAGNSETAQSYLFTINDKTAPLTSASVPSGVYGSAQTVTLTCSDALSGCDKTFYSLTGTPTVNSDVFTTPLLIRSSTTVRFFSRDQAGNLETVRSVIYTITDTTPPVTEVSPAAGSYLTAQTVTLACGDAGSGCGKIYYTTNGSTPTASSTEYAGPITISQGTTLKFFAKDLAGNSEGVKTALFDINPGAYKRGDVNKEGGIDIADALLIFQAYLSGATLTGDAAILCDVAPLASNGVPAGDGRVDLGDVVTIMRRIVGAIFW